MSVQKGALKGFLAFSGSLIALATATPAIAQDGDNEIIVTAQKREQDIQDVPLAVTALGGDQLQNAGVVDIRALQTLSPSINLNSTQTESGGTTMRIRGVGTTGNNAGLESAVGVFIDGVYVSRPSIALGELLDVQQVEILRGPQGTLFGRNTSAGAVTVTTRAPNLNEFGAFGNMTVGSIAEGDAAGLLQSQVGVNIPIIQDQLGIRVAAAGRVRDGLLTSTLDEADRNTRDRYVVRAQALWEPTDEFSLRFIVDHQEGQDECCAAVTLVETALFPGYTGVFGAGFEGAPEFGYSALEARRANGDRFEDPGEQTGYTLQADWDSPFGALTYIGSYRDAESGPNVQDSDFVNLDVFGVGFTSSTGTNDNFGSNQYTSHELRLAGQWGRLDWMVGYYYGKEEIEGLAELTLGSDFQANTNANLLALIGAYAALDGISTVTALSTMFPGFSNWSAFAANPSAFLTQLGTFNQNPNGSYGRNYVSQDGESQSIFTHNTFAVTDRLDVTIGARYVEETKDGVFDQLGAAANLACPGALTQAAGAGTIDFSTNYGGTLVTNLATAQANLAGAGYFASASLWGTGAPASWGLANQLNAGFTCFPFAAAAGGPPGSPVEFSNTFEDEELVYTANASYAFTDDIRGYASFTHGFKSGGFNLDPTAAIASSSNPTGDPRFDSEIVDSYELGLKTQLFDDRLRANFAVFRSEMEDFQVLEFTGVQFVTFNVPNVIAEGAEMELQGFLTENLSASLGVTYTDARYPDDCAGSSTDINITSLCGSQLTNAPEWVAILGVDYERNFADNLRFFLSGSVRYEDERRTSTQSHVVSASLPVRSVLAAEDIQEANTKVNLRVGIGGQDQRWALELWGTNIFDEQTRNVTFNIPLRGAAQYVARGAFLEEPAIYGLTLRANY